MWSQNKRAAYASNSKKIMERELLTLHQQFEDEYCDAADGGYSEQPDTQPCSDDTCSESDSAGKRWLGRFDYRRESHDGQGHIWDIVKEGLGKAVPDRALHYQWWDDSHAPGGESHDEYVDVNV